LRQAEGGAKIVGVFRVKNHDFTPKNDIFSNCRGRAPDIACLGGVFAKNTSLRERINQSESSILIRSRSSGALMVEV